MRKFLGKYFDKFLQSVLALRSVSALIGRSRYAHANITPNTDRNQKTIEALIAAGSNLDKPHHIEHHFYCYSRELLSGLTTKGSALGYQIARIGKNNYQGSSTWYADLVKETPLDLKSIDEENSRLLRLAVEFKGKYDGWGTKVVL